MNPAPDLGQSGRRIGDSYPVRLAPLPSDENCFRSSCFLSICDPAFRCDLDCAHVQGIGFFYWMFLLILFDCSAFVPDEKIGFLFEFMKRLNLLRIFGVTFGLQDLYFVQFLDQ